MKKILLTVALVAASSVFANKLQDIKPQAEKAAVAPVSVEWENQNDAALKAACADDVLARFVADEASATALLANVKGAYKIDSMIARQIAAVTQYVMIDDAWYWFWFDGPRATGRKIWVKALMARVKGAGDDYVKQFCLDQLRWCAYPCTANCIKALAETEKSKAVKDFEEMVVRELTGKGVGY